MFSRKSMIIYMLLYVDDIIIRGINSNYIHNLILHLEQEFELRSLGELHHFLGIKIERLASDLFLTQSAYVTKILQHACMSHCKPVSTPIALKSSTCNRDFSPMSSARLYWILVGSLQYLSSQDRISISWWTSFVTICIILSLNTFNHLSDYFIISKGHLLTVYILL